MVSDSTPGEGLHVYHVSRDQEENLETCEPKLLLRYETFRFLQPSSSTQIWLFSQISTAHILMTCQTNSSLIIFPTINVENSSRWGSSVTKVRLDTSNIV